MFSHNICFVCSSTDVRNEKIGTTTSSRMNWKPFGFFGTSHSGNWYFLSFRFFFFSLSFYFSAAKLLYGIYYFAFKYFCWVYTYLLLLLLLLFEFYFYFTFFCWLVYCSWKCLLNCIRKTIKFNRWLCFFFCDWFLILWDIFMESVNETVT